MSKLQGLIIIVLLLSVSTYVSGQNKESLVIGGQNFGKTRQQKAEAYLAEFASPAFKDSYTNIYSAIKNVLILLPEYAFEKVTDRSFPVLFTEVPHFGTGRWANSSGIYVMPDDPPTFTKGMWIVKLNTELNEGKDVEAIEGVVFHELAHRVLGHEGGHFSIEVEKEANHLVKKWGFQKQYLKAKASFGTKATH